ncbi:MAG: hypothetical protein WBW34_05500, partial [Nitrososphaeraceae archaeon]
MITVVIAFLPIIFNPIPVDTLNEPGSYNKPRGIDVYSMFMINKESFDQYVLYFRQIDLFSDLSRNTTSSPSSSPSSNDLFESEKNTEFQSDIETNMKLNSENEVSIQESEANRDNMPNSSLN